MIVGIVRHHGSEPESVSGDVPLEDRVLDVSRRRMRAAATAVDTK
jgi:hypothetical protein